MIDLKQIQKDIWAHKKSRGFNTTNMEFEFGLTYGELAEAFDSWRKKKGDVGEELADVMIYLLSLAEMNGVELEDELLWKIEKNKRRKYEKVNGVMRRVEEG
jgi:NTP pyrophosphatase (non-canonical NTP hydrolase)